MILMHAELNLEKHIPSLFLQAHQEAHYYHRKSGVQMIGLLVCTYTDTEESAFVGWGGA